MPTILNKFYFSAINDDQAFGATVKQLVAAAPAVDATTFNTWTSTTPAIRTTIPMTTSTTATDTSADNGWAFNNGGADGLGSTATEKRIIPAGVWGFSVAYTLNSPALLATISCTVVANVYRVASGGGTRTLLFSASSGNFSATGVPTWNSAPQPMITLEAGEVIHIGFVPTSAATAATALGAITNTTLRFNTGANSFITVPSPGVRTDYLRIMDTAIGVGYIDKQLSIGKTIAITGTGAVSHTKSTTIVKSFDLIGTGSPNYSKDTSAQRTFSLTGRGMLTRTVAVAEDYDLTGIGTPSFTRSANIFKTVTLAGKGTVPRDALIIIFLERSVAGKGTVTYIKATQAVRVFNVGGKGLIPTTGPNATTIVVPIDKLPGGGIVAATTYIFPILD